MDARKTMIVLVAITIIFSIYILLKQNEHKKNKPPYVPVKNKVTVIENRFIEDLKDNRCQWTTKDHLLNGEGNITRQWTTKTIIDNRKYDDVIFVFDKTQGYKEGVIFSFYDKEGVLFYSNSREMSYEEIIDAIEFGLNDNNQNEYIPMAETIIIDNPFN